MKNLMLFFGSLLLTLPAQAVKVGDTLDQVLLEKGQPERKLEAGANLVLIYKSGSVKLTDRRVVTIRSSSELAAPNVKFTPAPTQMVAPTWTTDATAALVRAKTENKKVMLFFTGSDWCIWCKRIEQEILSKEEFVAYARDNLVLVKLDFPNAIPQTAALKAQNQKLAGEYGIQGYPTLIVLDRDGKKVSELGYQAGGPAPLIDALKAL